MSNDTFKQNVMIITGAGMMWESQNEQADGSVIGTMLNPDLLLAVSTALSLGSAVRVLEPDEMKQYVVE